MDNTEPATDDCWELLREGREIAAALAGSVEAIIEGSLTTADRLLALPAQLRRWNDWDSRLDHA